MPNTSTALIPISDGFKPVMAELDKLCAYTMQLERELANERALRQSLQVLLRNIAEHAHLIEEEASRTDPQLAWDASGLDLISAEDRRELSQKLAAVTLVESSVKAHAGEQFVEAMATSEEWLNSQPKSNHFHATSAVADSYMG